nr:DMT family transporter [uncultured Albidiferax sp.]
MQTKYFVQLVALSALWGSSFMLTRLAVPTLGPNLVAGLRMAMATLVLGAIMRVARQPWPWAQWREMFLLGALAVAGPHFFYSWSSLELPAAYGSLLSVTAVLFGAFISAYMKEEALTPVKLMGCLLGFGGAALVVQLGPVNPTPLLVLSALGCVAGAALSGLSTPFLKRATTRLEPLAITAGMHATGALLLLPGALYDLPRAHFTLPALAGVVLMGTTTSGMAYWMYMRIMRHVPPVAALSSTFLVTGFGVLFSIIFLGEATGPGLYAGGALIVLASMMVMGFNPFRRTAA